MGNTAHTDLAFARDVATVDNPDKTRFRILVHWANRDDTRVPTDSVVTAVTRTEELIGEGAEYCRIEEWHVLHLRWMHVISLSDDTWWQGLAE